VTDDERSPDDCANLAIQRGRRTSNRGISDSADEGIRERIIEDMRRRIPQPVRCSLNS
jgi:hypothetical protein